MSTLGDRWSGGLAVLMLLAGFVLGIFCSSSGYFQFSSTTSFSSTDERKGNSSSFVYDPDDRRVAFQFLIGLEGTGHHLHQALYRLSPVGRWLWANGMDKDLDNLSLALWDKTRPSNGIWSASYASGDTKSEEGGPEGGVLFDSLVKCLQTVEKKIEESVQADSMGPSPPPKQPVVVAINAGAAINTRGKTPPLTPLMSYPMLEGPFRVLQFPNIDLLYEACDVARVWCQHSVVWRDPYRVIRSTTMNRHFSSRHVQLATLTTMNHVILSQMMAHSHSLAACWEADVEIPYGLGRLFGWSDQTSFADAYNKTFIEPSPITEDDKKAITKDTELQVYMNAMLASNDRIKKLCLEQLNHNSVISRNS